MGVSLTLVATRAAAERTAGRALRLQPHHSTQTVFLGHRSFACGTCSWSAAEDRGIDPVLAAKLPRRLVVVRGQYSNCQRDLSRQPGLGSVAGLADANNFSMG